MFSRIVDKVGSWCTHRHAASYLGAISFAESSFFPIPPDVLLAPMVLSRPERAWSLAGWTTFCSVLGGVGGFVVAAYAMDGTAELLQRSGHWESFLRAQGWFESWGFWAVLVAGFSPIPYKVFAFAAGGMSMSLPAFVIASILGRGGRFFLVAALVSRGGPRVAASLRSHVDRIGWATVAAIVLVYLVAASRR